MWQLKKLSTGEALNEPQRLPENWGPIFGMDGIKDRLADLSWLGENFVGQGWFEVGEEAPIVPTADEVNAIIAQMLTNTAWAVAVDNTTMTKGERAAWIEFREALRNIPAQTGFPANIVWPTEPRV